MFTINETLAILEKDKAKIEKQIELVKKFSEIKTADFTEEVYHEFCETTLRGGEILGEKLASVFPYLVYNKDRSNCNEYVFDFKDIKSNKYFDVYVMIPNNTATAIEIKVHKKKYFLTNENDIKNIEKQVEELEKILTYTFFQRVEWCGKGFRNWFKPIHYIIKHNRKEVNNEVTTVIEEKKKKIKTIREKQLKNKIMTEMYKRITDKIISEYVPQFLEWSNVVMIDAAYGKQRIILNNKIFT